MIMKQLFRHTTSLLRTALLLGAAALFNVLPTQAQKVSITADMPDPFETIATPTIGQGDYYFIQFYQELDNSPYLIQSFLGEKGEGAQMQAMDYMPFAGNRLWTLVPGSDANHFKLKSKRGYFVYYENNRFFTTLNENNASDFSYKNRGRQVREGYKELLTTIITGTTDTGEDITEDEIICRYSSGEWADIIKSTSTGYACYLRFVKLKPNVAHIIYYREGGADNSAPQASTIRHYLTYSGSDSEVTASVIFNGDLNAQLGGGDVSCFYIGDPSSTTPRQATITDGIGVDGSKGISITSRRADTNPQDWDTQFFIRSKDVIPAGKTVHVKFDYKASASVNGVQTQAHSEPGNFLEHGTFGSLNFTTSWQTYEGTITVSNDINNFQTIAINLSLPGTDGVVYYFDNIVFEAPITPEVSSRRSIIPPDKSLWTLPTAAAYHQDGLWELVPDGDNGNFFIKRYGEEQYLTIRQRDTYQYYTILGNKDDLYGRFNLEASDAVRYTRIHNACPLWGLGRFISYNGGDGSPIIQGAYNNDSWWYAGFYPVEVPVPNKDEFFQVLVGAEDNGNDVMLCHDGGFHGYSEEPEQRQLWQLEQMDDYAHFRLKDKLTGKYLKGPWQMTEPNISDDAETDPNTKFFTDFSLKWYYVDPASLAQKEIPVKKGDDDLYSVIHKESYLKQYAEAFAEAGLDLGRQGLATEVQSDWWNYDKNIQKVNHFEITHYVKLGNSMVVEFPTVLTRSNDHVYYQRFYNYDEADASMDLDNLKAHVSLDTRDDGNVQYFLYKNGIVTGRKLDWTGIDNGGMERNEQRRFNFTNSDGKRFTVAVDVSRYSDFEYKNKTTHLAGDLVEPSLTMRYIYYMRDAKEMAANLTACTSSTGKWLESKVFHFPSKQIAYESIKKAGYRGEFIGIRHIFSDYWTYDDPKFIKKDELGKVVTDEKGNVIIDKKYINDTYHLKDSENNITEEELNDFLENHLVSAVKNVNEGRIVVRVDDTENSVGIRLGGYNPNIDLFGTTDGNDSDYKGYYHYDKMGGKNSYGDSRFVVFRYPSSGEIAANKIGKKTYLNVYFVGDDNTEYQLARYTIIFDENSETKPWKSVTLPVATTGVQGTDRDPNRLREKAGKPIAKITFDYPVNEKYHYPASDASGPGTRHDGGDDQYGTIDKSSPIPLTFDNTNYAFDGDGANWGSYAMVDSKSTIYGNFQKCNPCNAAETGYGIAPDAGLQNGFLYIDASEQPGDICSAPFVGDFCTGDKLRFSGWISGSNQAGGADNRCPGGVTLTIKGEHNLHDSEGRIIYDDNGNPKKEIVTLYRFCPGQCYELNDNTTAIEGVSWGVPDAQKNQYNVVWQQFYFEFVVGDKYDRHWIEVNNNCVSSNGGDFMLDNIEVYAVVPEVVPSINTPLCVKKDGTTEMRLLKLSINYNKLKSSRNVNGDYAYEGFAFLDKYKFLDTFRTELRKLTNDEKAALHLSAFDFTTITLDELADAIEDGGFSAITGDNEAYQKAFDAAILGNKTTWYSHSTDPDKTKMNSSIMYFRWSTTFEDDENMPVYSFADAVNKKHAVYRETDNDGVKWVVMNGNFPELQWRTNTDYYIINTPQQITIPGNPFTAFNLCSECTKASVFRIEPPYTVLGLEKSEGTDDYVVCEGQIPTVVLNLKGYDLTGKAVDMTGLNFDWWLGNNTAEEPEDKLATLDNYHKQHKEITYEDAEGSHTVDVKLDEAIAALRSYYPSITSLDGVIQHLDDTPNLSLAQVLYLQEVVGAGQLVLHQSSINVPAKAADQEDPYFYLVACPIHDVAFDQALNPQENQYVAYFCDEPQGLRIKVGQKAPTLKCGFVPNENGISAYNYNFPEGTDPVLSIRLAKKAQFEEVQHGKVSDNPAETYNTTADSNKHFLWLPIRNAVVSTGATGVVRKTRATVEGSDDYNVYLSSTDDPTWDKKISAAMSGNNPSLPIVGKIVKLNAIDTSKNSEKTEKDENRLCIYFIKYLTDAQDENKVFEVREGYNYTLSLPFKENAGNNSCDGNILINLKIVPDYEVWTGAAGNTDWNNDQNWRRADGNTASGGLDDLYVGAAKTGSPLKDYKTNSWNYRTPKDRIFRKGFAPLYCTHVLMSRDEWGNAPELYDALDGKNSLTASPFPNLRDEDGWDGSTGDNKKKATATSILKFDMQARLYDIWSETYGSAADKGRSGDILAEMYQVNSCDEIAFQPGTELLNAHLLNYNSAWMEFELDTKRWYLLGSPLQGTISGEWYAPTGTAQQKTTYYDNVTFGSGYDRYSPAIYQRSWDKAKAVLYEVGADYATGDDAQNNNDDNASQGSWGTTWQAPTGGADAYLDRLGYKPFGAKMANVAIKGIWSNTYNDAQVDYGTGGFSVMVMNHLKGNDADVKAVIRLPKEDTMYDYYSFDEDGSDNGGTDTYLIDHNNEQGVQNAKGRALNRGRLKTDLLLPVSNTSLPLYQRIQREETSPSRYGDMRTYTRVPTQVGANALPMTLRSLAEDVAVGASNLGYYLVENPFPCGLDMKAFFAENSGLQKKYWLLTTAEAGQSPRQQLVQQAPNGEWVTASEGTFAAANGIVAPGQGFFVEIVRNQQAPTTITYTKAMQKQSRYGVKSDNGTTYNIEVGRSQVTEDVLVDADGDGTPETTVQKIVYEEDGVTPKTTPIMQDVVVYNYVQASGDGKRFPLKTRGEGAEAILPGLVITAERDNYESSALVMQRDGASNDFLPEEDTEAFINSDLVNAPTVYTLCGRLATTINTVRDFRSLPLGVESTSDAPCTLTFRGVEMLGDSISFYDAVEQKLTPLESGMTFKVSGQTQNRYYLVRSLNLKDAAEETHLQIFTEGLKAKVIASTAEPITVVRCFDTAGRLICTASPQLPEYSFDLPRAGVYIIEAETEHDRKTRKVIVK